MAHTYQLQIEVQSRDPIPADQLERLMARLIDVGLEDAHDAIEEGEGDLTQAEMVTTMTIHRPRIVPT